MAKYDALREHLRALRTDLWQVSFDDVAALVPGGLPSSAFQHQAWWANSRSHPESVAWLDAGWRTEHVNLTDRTVRFVRTRPAAGTGD